MVRRARDREASDRNRVAPPRLRSFLGLEVEAHRTTTVAPEVVALIVKMAGENPLWSRRRIANELDSAGCVIATRGSRHERVFRQDRAPSLA
jgi:hypothetical protein